jgi:ligand-binding sensor domain-containing protein
MIIYNEDDGLANNDVRDLTKDEQGYLWIATGNGLSKFDGNKFINFHTTDGLPGNMVWAVAHDEKNRIYAACYRSGLAIIENDKIVKVLHINGNDGIRKLYYSKQHHLLFLGTDKGIYALQDSTFHLLSYPNSPAQSSILSILEHEGVIYFTDYNCGLFRIDICDQEISKSKVTRIIGIGNGYALAALDHAIYTSYNGDIYQYLPAKKTISLFAKRDSLFLTWAMASFKENKILLGGTREEAFHSGIKILDISTHKISALYSESKISAINNLIVDEQEGLIWICTETGLQCMSNSPFEVIPNVDKSKIIDIKMLNDSLFVLTNDNVWLYKNGKQEILYDKNFLFRKVKERSDNYLSKIGINKNRNHKLIGNRYYEKEIKLISLNSDGNRTYLVTYLGSLSFPDLKSYLPINSGNFISTENSSLFWSPKYHNLLYYPSIKKSSIGHEFSINKSISDIVKIVRKGEAIILASAFNGLYVIKGNNILQLNSSNSKIDDMLTDLDVDKNGEIWCTSKTGNLFHIGIKECLAIVQTFNKDNSKIIGENYKWLKFSRNHLYIGTNKGLNKIPVQQLQNPVIDSVFFFNQNNGYDYISADAPECDTQGNIYVFNPTKIIKISDQNIQIPQRKIVFNEVSLDDIHTPLNQLNNRNLSSNTKNIRIKFFVLKYPNSKNVKYRYRINESEWNKGNEISLQSLKSGEYKITCEAQDIETSSDYSDSLFFQINKPFWLSGWFLILFVLLFISVIYLIIHSRFVLIAKRKDEKDKLNREIAELHIQSLQSQMNPHFVFNSLNSIQSYILSNKIIDAANYLSSLGKLIRINLEHISEEYISLTDEIRFLEEFIKIEKLRFKEVLNFTFTCSIENTDHLFLPPMLIQPLIENSIKYRSNSGKEFKSIQIEFELNQGLLITSVTDNGIGRDRSLVEQNNDHKGMGLKLINERLELLNKKNDTTKYQMIITDLFQDEIPLGTKVQIIIPQLNRKK